MDKIVVQMIEQLRAEMIHMYERLGNLNDPRLIKISQELDVFLVKVQRQRKASGDSAKGDHS